MKETGKSCAEVLEEKEELLITSVFACVSVRLRELREDCAPLQPHSPVCLWNRGLPPYLCIRGGGPPDGGESRKEKGGNMLAHFYPTFASSHAETEPSSLFAVQTQKVTSKTVPRC